MLSAVGYQSITPPVAGWPAVGLQDLMLLAEASGTDVLNAVAARPSGLIERPQAGDFGGSFTRLAGGGVQINGTQIITLPEFDPRDPWMFISAAKISGHVSGGAEAITALLSVRDRSTAAPRGPLLMARGWQTGGVAGYFQHRMWSGSVDGSLLELLPSSGRSLSGRSLLSTMSYNGSDTLESRVYDLFSGALLASGALAATDIGMTTTIGGVVSNLARPTVGISNSVYDGGIQQVEAVGRYSRIVGDAELSLIRLAVVDLVTGRGRAA